MNFDFRMNRRFFVSAIFYLLGASLGCSLQAQMRSTLVYGEDYRRGVLDFPGRYIYQVAHYPQASMSRDAVEKNFERDMRAVRFWSALQKHDSKTARQIFSQLSELETNEKTFPTVDACAFANALATMEEAKRNFADANELRQKIFVACGNRYGDDHWLTRTASQSLEYIRQLEGLSVEQHQQLVGARKFLHDNLIAPVGFPNPAISESLAQVEVIRSMVGENNYDLVNAVASFSRIHEYDLDQDLPDVEKARSLVRELPGLSQSAFGKNHPVSMDALNWFYKLHSNAHEYERATEYLLQISEAIVDPTLKIAFENSEFLPTHLNNLQSLADENANKDNVESATNLRNAKIKVAGTYFGERSWQHKTAIIELKITDKMRNLNADERALLATAEQSLENANQLAGEQKFEEAQQAFQKYVELREQVIDVDSIAISKATSEFAVQLLRVEQAKLAESCLENARKRLAQTVGLDHPIAIDLLSKSEFAYRMFINAAYRNGDLKSVFENHESLIGLHDTILGSHHHKTKLWRDYLRNTKLRSELSAAQQQALGTVEGESAAARYSEYGATGQQMTKRMAVLRRSLELHESCFGKKNGGTLRVMIDLANVYSDLGHFDRALPLYREAAETGNEIFGKFSFEYSNVRDRQSALLIELGDAIQGQDMKAEAWLIKKQMGFRFQFETGVTLTAKSAEIKATDEYVKQLWIEYSAHNKNGDVVAALPVAREIVRAVTAVNGRDSEQFFAAKTNQAAMLTELGDQQGARSIYNELIGSSDEFWKTADGKSLLAICHHNLAVSFVKSNENRTALAHLNDERSLLDELGNNDSIGYYQSLEAKAVVHGNLKENEQAKSLHENVLAWLTSNPQENNQLEFETLNNQVELMIAMGETGAADASLVKAEQLAADSSGGIGKSKQAKLIHTKAVLAESIGNFDTAKKLYRDSIERVQTWMKHASLVQSVRQQNALSKELRLYLDSFLAMGLRQQLPAEEIYQQMLVWKGLALLQKRQILENLDDEQLNALFNQLSSVSSQLSREANWQPHAHLRAGWIENLQLAVEKKEELERALTARFDELSESLEEQLPDAKPIADGLGDGVALVDFYQFRNYSWGPAGTGEADAPTEVVAFIVRNDRDINYVSLGPLDQIDQAVSKWRESLGRDSASGQTLRQLVWSKIEGHLDGIATVVVSPDGPIGQIPFAALPDEKAGSYLIERFSFVSLPGPQLLLELLQDPVEPPANELLLVGYVDYGEPQVQTGAETQNRNSANSVWNRLPATRAEMADIRFVFEETFPEGICQMLPGTRATEWKIRQLIPTQRWVHFATHGFFADRWKQHVAQINGMETDTWDLFSFHPDSLTGLVLANANNGPNTGDDGMITAMEAGELDLRNVELAVLSACESALGDYRQNEGLISLQRSFHQAGADSVIASLWKVKDSATQQLMSRFYTNLWEGKMGRAEALREAQLWMLNHPDEMRGLDSDDESSEGSAKTPPFYWAAWVLSGDWR